MGKLIRLDGSVRGLGPGGEVTTSLRVEGAVLRVEILRESHDTAQDQKGERIVGTKLAG